MNIENFRTEIKYGDDWFSITGSQLFSKRRVKMMCRYRQDNNPAVFVVDGHRIPATVEFMVHPAKRGYTSVCKDGVRVDHTEHILSALYGLGVLDSDIFLEYEDESPIEGEIGVPEVLLNSREFSFAIASCFPLQQQAGKHPQELDKCYIIIEENSDTPGDPSCAVFAPLDKLYITTQINFPTFWGLQAYSQVVTPLDYLKSLCWARSFFGKPAPHSAKRWKE